MSEGEVKTVKAIAELVAGAGMNNVSLLTGGKFSGTYWISANDLYFRITGRHLNDDFENKKVKRNKFMDELQESLNRHA